MPQPPCKMTILAAALALVAQAHGAWAGAFLAATPVERVEPFQQRQREIAAYMMDSRDLSAVRLLFLGDSITDWWSMGELPWQHGQSGGRAVWEESFAGRVPENLAFNIGISGDRTEHVLYRILPKSAGGLGELDRPDFNPEFVILMIGINNAWPGMETPIVDSVYNGIHAVIDAVHERRPKAIVILESLLPNKEPGRNRDIVMPVNERLVKLAASKPYSDYVTYLDLYPHFVDATGVQVSSLFLDGLHPNEAGYRVWRDALVPALEHVRDARRR